MNIIRKKNRMQNSLRFDPRAATLFNICLNIKLIAY